ncbi:pancreatic triacylglycerol lipase-like isoform X2 [Hylaeus volcanicus]|uniref:pancreatic triacylglycerol lipase-like isoform X2 n=1 Tax=Hylaeus volcanicus TaxID=313075 RepID=UPI0023B7D631|nr:pancreatic triacylglycerol lipase-like isoform X2 [Hylaeus volcanicus]
MSKLCTRLCVILCLTMKDIASAGICDQENSPGAVGKIRLKIFKGDSSSPTSSGNIAEDIEADKDSILYVHGFMEGTESDNVQIIVKAYLEKGDVNIILVDWGDIAIDLNYVYVASQVPMVGKVVAESLEKLAETIDLNTLHVIGHSLGAHIAGHIGRYVNNTLARITELCSHQRSTKIYAESLTNPKAFLAHRCFDKLIDPRNGDTEIYFGDSTPKNIYGAYCFNTNAESPYGKGA